MGKVTDTLVAANTHWVGWGGFILVTIGTLAPSLIHFLWTGEPDDVMHAIGEYGRYLAFIGGSGAFIGLAPQIKSKPTTENT